MDFSADYFIDWLYITRGEYSSPLDAYYGNHITSLLLFCLFT